MKELAAAILKAMVEKDHSLQEAADEMLIYKGHGKLSKGSVRAWSKGFLTHRPAQENWDAIAQYVGVHPYTVMGWLGVLASDDVDMLLNRGTGLQLSWPVLSAA